MPPPSETPDKALQRQSFAHWPGLVWSVTLGRKLTATPAGYRHAGRVKRPKPIRSEIHP